jgi:hypothetical protein
MREASDTKFWMGISREDIGVDVKTILKLNEKK